MDAEFIKLFHLCVKVTREQLGRPLREKNASTFAKVGLAALFAALFLLPVTAIGQTFRGGINGVVTDQSGAVVSEAQVTAVETSTNAFYKTVSSSAGEFAFTDLPLGNYSVTISAIGFST
jgi:hypothetical protein